MKYPNFNEEKKLWRKGFNFVAGLDEAGRGPLAGPVVAGAVFFKPGAKFLLQGINDSKKPRALRDSKCSAEHLFFKNKCSGFDIRDSKQMSVKQREEAFKILTNHKDIEWGIGIVSEKIIDKINILEATKLAMQKALRQAQGRPNKTIEYLLIDGNFKIKSDIPQKSIIRGDQKVISISAASIIAKVTRDKIMEKYDKKYPQYGFKKHKGYPTLAPRNILKKIGPCPIHRKTFFPVSTLHKA